MALTDLTNTIWYFKGDGEISSSSSSGYNINFISDSMSFDSLQIVRSKDGDDYDITLTYINISSGPINSPYSRTWTNEAYCTIEITGGSDATNPSLIAWLNANAAQIPVTDLTNTTWTFKNIGIVSYGSGSNTRINLNGSVDDTNIFRLLSPAYQYGTNFATFDFHFEDDSDIFYLVEGDYFYNNVSDGEGWYTYIDGTYTKLTTAPTITITGGDDVTNTAVIAWLVKNARQVINIDKYISSIKQNNQKYLIKDNEVRASITNVINTSVNFSVGEDDTLVWTVGGHTPPTEYIIPTGMYYGKATPSISSLPSDVSTILNLIYESNNVSYNQMIFSKDFRGRLYIEYGQNNPAYSVSTWESSYRAIKVTTDTIVTQVEYEAFFACFDAVFQFSVQRVGSSSDSTYYVPFDYTWQQFISDSTYDPNSHFSTFGDYVDYTSFPIYWKNTLVSSSRVQVTDLVSNHSSYYFTTDQPK